MGKQKINRNLLIISCSQRKKKFIGKVKAWDLYDGVMFRMLKKVDRERGLPANLYILILSAKHGFIKPVDLIKYYDCRMREEEIELRKVSFLGGLKQWIANKEVSSVFVCLGKDYLRGIDGFEKLFPEKTTFIFASGGIGTKMSKTKNWLLMS